MKGITVTLYDEIETGTNSFGEPVYEKTAIEVDNVLVAPASPQEVLDSDNLYGKKVEYTLGIPKEDTHNWQDRTIEFWGENWESFGIPTKGIDSLVPTKWNMKVMVMRRG